MALRALFSLIIMVLCTSCRDDTSHTLRVGVTQGPLHEITEYVQYLAQEKGVNVEIITFDDFLKPNEALAKGLIHMNIYQHAPFLHHAEDQYHYGFKVRAHAVFMPLGLYAAPSIPSLQAIPDQAKLLIPADPTNRKRALLFLHNLGLITLSQKHNPTRKDILTNPKHLRVVEVESPLIPRLLHDDGDIAVIHADWAMVADLDPKTALALEQSESSDYDILMVTQNNTPSDLTQRIDTFIRLFQSPDVRDFILDTYKGSILPAWNNNAQL